MAIAETAELVARLRLQDQMSGGLKRASGNLGKFESSFGKVAGGMGKMSSGLARAGTRIAAGIGIGLAGAAKAAIDWEDAFQGVVKTVKASDTDLDSLATNLREMSTRMPMSAIELAGIAEAAGQMGVGVDKAGNTSTAAIAKFTEQVAILVSTTNLGAEEAATALGQMTSAIQLSADEYDNFAAALVAVGNAGSSTEGKILEIERRSASVGKQIGLTKEQTLGWAAAVANLPMRQELSGTALQSFYLKVNKAVGQSGEGLRVLSKTAGMSAAQFKKLYNKNTTTALERFVKGLAGLDKFAQQKAIESVFGTQSGLTRTLVGLAGAVDSVDGLTNTLDVNRQAWFESTAAQEEFAKRNATVQSAITRLKNGVIDAAVSVGEGFAPALGRSADKLAAFLKTPGNRTDLQNIGKDIGKAIDEIDWNEVLTGAKQFVGVMKIALDYAKRIYDAIRLLPKEVQAAGAGFLVLNKLSGGLLGAGAADVIGGLAGALSKSLAASIPVVGKAFVQPVLVTNFPPGFGGGGGATGAAAKGGIGIGTIAKVFVAGIAVAAAVELGQEFARQSKQISEQGTGLVNQAKGQAPGLSEADTVAALNKIAEQGSGLNAIALGLTNVFNHGLDNLAATENVLKSHLLTLQQTRDTAGAVDFRAGEKAPVTDDATKQAVTAAGDTFDRATTMAKTANVAALAMVGSQVTNGTMGTTGAVNNAANRIVAGFHSIPAPIVNVTTNVTASDVVKTTVSKSRQGPEPSRSGGQQNPGQTWGGGP